MQFGINLFSSVRGSVFFYTNNNDWKYKHKFRSVIKMSYATNSKRYLFDTCNDLIVSAYMQGRRQKGGNRGSYGPGSMSYKFRISSCLMSSIQSTIQSHVTTTAKSQSYIHFVNYKKKKKVLPKKPIYRNTFFHCNKMVLFVFQQGMKKRQNDVI